MKDIKEYINESYDCEGGIRGMTQKLDVQLTGKLAEDVKRIMGTLLYTYESYRSDVNSDFNSSKFKREYLYNEITKYMEENK